MYQGCSGQCGQQKKGVEHIFMDCHILTSPNVLFEPDEKYQAVPKCFHVKVGLIHHSHHLKFMNSLSHLDSNTINLACSTNMQLFTDEAMTNTIKPNVIGTMHQIQTMTLGRTIEYL